MIRLTREQKSDMIQEVQRYFEEERNESIGQIGAEQLIERMVQILGPVVYNVAISDARKLVMEKMNQIEDELYSIEKPTS